MGVAGHVAHVAHVAQLDGGLPQRYRPSPRRRLGFGPGAPGLVSRNFRWLLLTPGAQPEHGHDGGGGHDPGHDVEHGLAGISEIEADEMGDRGRADAEAESQPRRSGY